MKHGERCAPITGPQFPTDPQNSCIGDTLSVVPGGSVCGDNTSDAAAAAPAAAATLGIAGAPALTLLLLALL
jgi:hypothetical protein